MGVDVDVDVDVNVDVDTWSGVRSPSLVKIQ